MCVSTSNSNGNSNRNSNSNSNSHINSKSQSNSIVQYSIIYYIVYSIVIVIVIVRRGAWAPKEQNSAPIPSCCFSSGVNCSRRLKGVCRVLTLLTDSIKYKVYVQYIVYRIQYTVYSIQYMIYDIYIYYSIQY